VRGALATLVAATAFASAGCGAVGHLTADDGDPVRGKSLFVEHCNQCHVMKDAASGGKPQADIGPNLDDAFRPSRTHGFEESTIRDVVRGQIAYPEEETATGGVGMPANLVEGQEARDVADYVARCAGVDSCDIG
jgi:mono/diheme cytochrome c family protein